MRLVFVEVERIDQAAPPIGEAGLPLHPVEIVDWAERLGMRGGIVEQRGNIGGVHAPEPVSHAVSLDLDQRLVKDHAAAAIAGQPDFEAARL